MQQFKMSFIHCVSALVLVLTTATNARRITFNENGNPIRVVDTSYGLFDHERIDRLVAQIHPRHVTTNDRLNFPRSGHLNDYFVEAMAPGDERGHLVASQFSGPADWYNLSPQNARVNRNSGYQSITTDWFGAECEVRRFLDQGGNRYVDWVVQMAYVGNSNRPDQYTLTVRFMENGRDTSRGIVTHIHNPFLREDSRFWLCRHCRSNHHDDDDHDELLRRRRNVVALLSTHMLRKRRDADQCKRA